MNAPLSLASVAAMLALLGSLARGEGAAAAREGAQPAAPAASEAVAASGSAILARARQDAPPDAAAGALGPPPPVAAESLAPADLRVAAHPEPGGSVKLTLVRPGHLVYLRRGGSASAGREAASLSVDGGASGAPIVWETTRLDDLQTSRGQIRLHDDGAPGATGGGAPAITATHEGRLHRCEAHADGQGGFAALCLVRRSGAGVAAANGTDSDLASGVWVASGASTVVRLDLPGDRPLESRVFGFVDGAGKAVVVRVEASRVAGELLSQLSMTAIERSMPPARRSWFSMPRPWGDRRLPTELGFLPVSSSPALRLAPPLAILLVSLAAGSAVAAFGAPVRRAVLPVAADDLHGPPLPEDERRWRLAAAPPASRDDMIETGAAPPPDLLAEVDAPDDQTLTVSLRQRGHAVYLRHGGDERFGAQASLSVPGADSEGVVLDWESTDAQTLQTSWGRLRVGGERGALRPHLSMAGQPRALERHDAQGHRCQAHAEGGEGLVVVCVLDSGAAGIAAGNPDSNDSDEGVMLGAAGAPFVRLRLPGQQPLESRLFGYADGRRSVVLLLAESSRAAGEETRQLSLLEIVRRDLPPGALGIRHFHPHRLGAEAFPRSGP